MKTPLRHLFCLPFAAVCLALVVARAGGAGFEALTFELRLTGPARIEPLQAAEIELRLANPTAQPVTGVPRLVPSFRGLTFRLRHEGREVQLGKPVLNLANEEGTSPYRTLAPGAKDDVRFEFAYDWSRQTFLFREPGTYELWAVLRSEDGAQTNTTAPVRLVVPPPAADRQKEITELLATDAYQYAYAPEAIALDRDGDAKSAKLAAFASRHPASSYSTEIPLISASLHEYRALVTHKSDRLRADEHRQAQKAALLNYLRQSGGRHRDHARDVLKKQFGQEEPVR